MMKAETWLISGFQVCWEFRVCLMKSLLANQFLNEKNEICKYQQDLSAALVEPNEKSLLKLSTTIITRGLNFLSRFKSLQLENKTMNLVLYVLAWHRGSQTDELWSILGRQHPSSVVCLTRVSL